MWQMALIRHYQESLWRNFLAVRSWLSIVIKIVECSTLIFQAPCFGLYNACIAYQWSVVVIIKSDWSNAHLSILLTSVVLLCFHGVALNLPSFDIECKPGGYNTNWSTGSNQLYPLFCPRWLKLVCHFSPHVKYDHDKDGLFRQACWEVSLMREENKSASFTRIPWVDRGIYGKSWLFQESQNSFSTDDVTATMHKVTDNLTSHSRILSRMLARSFRILFLVLFKYFHLAIYRTNHILLQQHNKNQSM